MNGGNDDGAGVLLAAAGTQVPDGLAGELAALGHVVGTLAAPPARPVAGVLATAPGGLEAAEGILRDMKEKWNGHLSTGSRGSYPLLAVLSRQGRVDAAYDIMARTTYPSLGHMLSFGSKTIGECWESPEAPPAAARVPGVMATG